MNAPTGRKASVTVMVSAISASLLWNSFAMAVSAKTTRKKSNASSVQPRKLAMTAARWPRGAACAREVGLIASELAMRKYAAISMHQECLVIARLRLDESRRSRDRAPGGLLFPYAKIVSSHNWRTADCMRLATGLESAGAGRSARQHRGDGDRARRSGRQPSDRCA